MKIYVLLAPHVGGFGSGNKGQVARTSAGDRLVATRDNYWLALGADCGFAMTSCGFVGLNDGWTDIIANKRLPTWNFDSATGDNIALTAQINLQGANQFVMALGFCTDEGAEGTPSTPNPALVAVSEALSYPFDSAAAPYAHLQTFVAEWASAVAKPFVPTPGTTGDGDVLFNLSRNVLLSHEDKNSTGAVVASLSIPWGTYEGEKDGGYHLVWPRDMCQTATALLAAGEVDLPLRGLMYLATSQSPDGSFLQNFYIDGNPYWPGKQLDEFSFPIVLAYRLSQAGALGKFDPKPMVLAAAGAVIAIGPMTPEERWEENAGYSPSTLASNIAGLVCAADLAKTNWADAVTSQFLLDYADFLESHLETWCVTTQGDLLPGVPQHYIRILPTPAIGGAEDPNNASITLGNHAGIFPAKHIVDAGFLELVRYGIRSPGDPIIVNTLKVIDAVLKKNLPGGPSFYRYNYDHYGQGNNGEPFADPYITNGVTVGRPWPLLTGERGHYELAAGNNAKTYLGYIENFAGTRGLIPEQLWDSADLPQASPPLVQGGPTGSAMPLAWAHAEYIKLVRSVSDGKVFDKLDVVANRYLVAHAPSPLEIWNCSRQPLSIKVGKTLRILNQSQFSLHWSVDGWKTPVDTLSTATAVGVYYVDIPTAALAAGGAIVFTFFWIATQKWGQPPPYTVNLNA